jgi:3-deoxy-7-phosphoheptulonate synthase
MIKSMSHLPIIADPSHSTGRSQLVPPITLAAAAAGAHGIIVDVHPNPSMAKCDGAQALTFESFEKMMAQVRAVAQALGKVPAGATG